jgi:hypothetical protein
MNIEARHPFRASCSIAAELLYVPKAVKTDGCFNQYTMVNIAVGFDLTLKKWFAAHFNSDALFLN